MATATTKTTTAGANGTVATVVAAKLARRIVKYASA